MLVVAGNSVASGGVNRHDEMKKNTALSLGAIQDTYTVLHGDERLTLLAALGIVPLLSGNRVLFRTFSFILLTFIPLSPSFPLVLLTRTFLYTFQFSLTITGERTRNESIDWRHKSIVTVLAFTWLKGGPRLQCPLATAPTWAL
jgi:hypothetical protein